MFSDTAEPLLSQSMEKRLEEGVEEGPENDHERHGTVWTATAHIVTAVIGSGVLALPWSVAQLGWITGPLALLGFSAVTNYTSALLANCYRAPDPVSGARNPTYMLAVRSYLGPRQVFMCGVAQYVNLWGTLVGYTITTSTSMIAMKRSICFIRHGHGANCDATSGSMLVIGFGVVQVVLSQFPSLENITWLSIVAAAMSFAYSFISLGLSTTRMIANGEFRGDLTGANANSPSEKTWNALLALGNIAFAYTFAEVLIEIQNTLKSPPAENKTMKKATRNGIGLTTMFYLSLGCIGYAAFGNVAPGNILTGFESYNPFWLVDIANLCLIIHLVGAYQVYAQPIFASFENRIASWWPNAKFINKAYTVRIPVGESGSLSFTLSKIVLRSVFIIATTIVAMLLPFFNAVLGLLGALSFWPLTVYFPVSMHIAQAAICRGKLKWFLLQGLSTLCLIISVAVSVASVVDIVTSLKTGKFF